MFDSKILIELVPKTCFYSNVRSSVTPEDWDIIRKDAYRRYNWTCSVCKCKGKMEAHEIWHYDDQQKIQKLHDIVSVCNACHMLYHLGFASIKGKLPQCVKRLSKLNGWTLPQTNEFVDIVFEIHHHRSQHKWSADLSWLDRFNIKYQTPSKDNR